jgi:UDP-N-acetylmuramate dehydrogenase
MNWPRNLKTEAKFHEPLKKYTTFKIGGPARIFSRPSAEEELRQVVNCCRRLKISFFLLGGGSNILISDKGVKGAVVKLDSGYFKNISFKGNFILAGCGAGLSEIIRLAADKGLSGVEFLAGIPASLGGALSMNAGAWGENIGDLVESVLVMDYNGNTKILGKAKLKFGYRRSNLSKYIILEARLKLTKKNKKIIKQDIKEYLARRKGSQDASLPSAGCVFKNPPGDSAGRLIDECGLKGRGCGGAAVSSKHANFILNRASAKASDVLKLMKLMQNRVKQKFGIDLEPEIKIWR